VSLFSVKAGKTTMFMSEYNHTLDTKGRLIIPTKYREELGSEFVVTKGFDGCLYAFPPSAWEEFQGKLNKLPVNRADARKLIRFFVAGAAVCELDRQGRILVPGTLREFAGLEKDVVLAGSNNRVEIWSKDRWTEINAVDDINAIAEQMGDLGFTL
jgi:MraZ protein